MYLQELIDDLLKKFKSGHGVEWLEGSGDNEDSASGSGRRRAPLLTKLWLVLGLLFVTFFIALPMLASFITELWWYQSQGFEQVFWRRFTAQLELFFVVLIPTFLIYFANWRLAWRFGEGGALFPAGRQRRMVLLAALAISMASAFSSVGGWGAFLRFYHATPFGETDPLFGRDIGFYFFSLPFLSFVRGKLQSIFVLSLAGSAAIYYLTRSISISTGRPWLRIPGRVRLHLTFLTALLLLAWGADYWFQRYLLLFSPTGVVFGAGYTDVAVILPALNVLTFAAAAAAALLLLNFFKPMWKLSAAVICSLLVLGWVSRTMLPALVQQYRVKPNEYEMESRFIGYSLDCTRRGFGLAGVKTVEMTPDVAVTAQELAADQETVHNIRLWDYSPLLRTYNQLQAIRTYYDFPDVFIDRYEIDGKNRQVILSVRELDLSQLQNRTWVNSRLEFTHGYGVVMNPVNEVAPGGLPNFFMKDLPTSSIVDIPLERPEIYHGTKPDSYVLVKTEVKEFNYPLGNSNIRSTYDGSGGVPIGTLWRRLVFTLRFRDSEILFTNALNKDSRIIFHRNAQQAISKLAPFLALDEDIYPVLDEGRVLWAQDCYTYSSNHPYSRPFSSSDPSLKRFDGVNYIRNSVKATVDAYDGKVVFYLVDDKDPLAVTWRKIFPALFAEGGEMTEGLRRHMRYPENLFEVQTEVYGTYHMTDTNTYYNREDVWEVTPAGRQRRIQPNYVTMRLWGGGKPEFAIIVPYMPLGRDNLIGWMAGRCDPENYGELLVYEFPKQKQIYGPAQIEALIDQNPEISAQLSLWGQHGSDVIRGDLLVVPTGKSLLYVQPLYIKAERGEMPELKRVIVSSGGRVTWDETFDGALRSLMGQKIAAGTTQQRAPRLDTPADGLAALARRAQTRYDTALRAQRDGDWAQYGARIKELGEVLSQMGGDLR